MAWRLVCCRRVIEERPSYCPFSQELSSSSYSWGRLQSTYTPRVAFCAHGPSHICGNDNQGCGPGLQLRLCARQQGTFSYDDGSLTLLMRARYRNSSQAHLDDNFGRFESVELTHRYVSGQAVPLVDQANALFPNCRRCRSVVSCQTVSAFVSARKKGIVVPIRLISFTMSVFQFSIMATVMNSLVAFS